MGIHQNGSRGVKQGWVLFTVIGLVIVVVTASVTHKIDHLATIPTGDRRSQDPPIKQQTLRLLFKYGSLSGTGTTRMMKLFSERMWTST